MQVVLAKANDVVNDENALEYEVNDMYKELLLSFLNLRLKPSKDKLEDLINKVEGLDSSKYTEETWANVEVSLTEAKNVMNNEGATQAMVDVSTKILNDAITSLVKAPVDGEGSEKPSEDNNGTGTGTGSNNGTNTGNGSSTGTSTPSKG